MTDLSADLGLRPNVRLRNAVYQHRALSAAGLSERLFARLFSGLVYPQIWEDPEVDIAAMGLEKGQCIVAIASGGCNVLAYLTRAPGRIDAVDLNPAHVALLRLKLAAARHLPGHADFFRFFGEPENRHNSAAYDRFVARHLDPATRRHWEQRSFLGKRRIAAFDRNFHRTGLLGTFIALGHAIAKLHGVDPTRLTATANMREQRAFFEEHLAPLFDRPLVRLATAGKASLFGLGIPPAQYDSLAEAGRRGMSDVLRTRLERLACHFPLRDNYFAWQAFARRYPAQHEGSLPLYLQAAQFAAIRDGADAVAVHHRSVTELLAEKPAASVDRYVLLDAQDWMTDAQLNALWSEIDRTATSGARVIFRTAAAESLLPGRVDDALLAGWRYEEEQSRAFCAADRSAIYGGFHLYVRHPR